MLHAVRSWLTTHIEVSGVEGVEPLHVDTDVAGRHSLAATIENHRADIVRRWLPRVQAALPTNVHPTDLKDAIDDYLAALAGALRRGGRVSVQAEDAWTSFAEEHALARVRMGFDVTQLVREFIELRRVLFEVFDEEGVLRQAEQAMRIADLIEGAISLAIGSYVSSRDYAARKQEAEHIGFVTHELKTPLSSAALTVDLLDRVPGQDRALLDRLRRNIGVVKALIDKVLLTERLDSVELANQPKTFKLGEVLKAALSSSREEAERRGLGFLSKADPDIEVHADPALTVSVIQNLAGNAVKYTDHGWVEILADDEGDHVTLHVRDTCPGISPEELRTIFEPFKRGHTRKPGTGLGLAIARRAVELQGGELHADSSESLGGCHFWFTLPKPPH